MLAIAERFRLEGKPVSCGHLGDGHINNTYLVTTDTGRKYVLQKVNTEIFRDPDGLMRNIVLVTDYLRARDPDPRHTLTLVPAEDGRPYILNERDGLWRVYEFISGGVCLSMAETPADFRQSALAFGAFRMALTDFPAEQLTETIPRFHDTPDRYRALEASVRADVRGRAAGVQREIDFLTARRDGAGELTDMLAAGELPLRVTHNDTKLNNVMLDAETRRPLCIMDLDTVMPGLTAYDFGDSIRFGASTAAEDERDLSRVSMSLDMYRVYTEGFLEACGAGMTRAETASLPVGARIMTLENAVRFLKDYLDGDVYYHIDRPEHNLDRARTQIRLVEDMEKKWDDMRRIAEKGL